MKGQRLTSAAIGLVLLAWHLPGQSSSSQPRFEVASIKPSAESAWAADGPIAAMIPVLLDPGEMAVPMPDPGRVRIRNMSLLGLVAMAYGVPAAQVRGQGWMGQGGFDVDATLPAGAQSVQVKQMLRSLLEERFGLAVHRETKVVRGYALVVGKSGAKLTPSAAAAEPAAGQDQQEDARAAVRKRALDAAANARGSRGSFPVGTTRSRFPNVTTGQFARILSRFVQAPVVDATGLKETYDVTLEISGDQTGDSVFEEVERLGLVLEARSVPTDTLVVDKAMRTPTPN